MQTFQASPVSRADIRRFALKIRAAFDVINKPYFDVVQMAENVFPEVFEKSGYQFLVESMEEMGNLHGLTDPVNGVIRIRQDVYDRACEGCGRDRMTIAHELGHFFLHDGVVLGMARVEPNTVVKTYCDPEWQASAFGGELLMPQHLIKQMTIDEVVRACGVSRDAAMLQLRYKNK